MEWLLLIPAALLVFLAVILIRGAAFKPKAQPTPDEAPVTVDTDAAVDALATLVRCKTVSYADPTLEDNAEFEKLIDTLPTLYPHVFATCEFRQLPDRALLFRWKGKSEGKPAVLMAHYDVVSAEEGAWEKPAFDGVIENGVLWGRGAIDTKVTLNAILFAAEKLIKEGFTPERDIYMAFGGDEEINGHGVADIVRLFVERKIEPGIVLDEGGAVVEGVFPGVKQPCTLVGIAEKGMLNIEYSALSGGGHSSSPEPHTPIGKLCCACVRVESRPFKFRITPPAKKMFDVLGRHSSFAYRLIFANLWFFSPMLSLMTKNPGVSLTRSFARLQPSLKWRAQRGLTLYRLSRKWCQTTE